MRLSDIKGDRVFDVIADIAGPVYSIATDEEARAFFKRVGGGDDGPSIEEKLRDAMPSLLRGHRDDLVAIMAAIEGVSAEEYRKNLTMAGLLKGLYEILTDEDLLAFLS